MSNDIPAATQGVNRYTGPDYTSVPKPWLEEQLAEIRRLRARVAELEAGAAITFGTLEQPTDDEPAAYTHNVPPSAPPHNERPPIGNDDE